MTNPFINSPLVSEETKAELREIERKLKFLNSIEKKINHVTKTKTA